MVTDKAPPAIHEHLLVRNDSPNSQRPVWYIRLTVINEAVIGFEIFEVCYHDEHTNTLMFLPEGWEASPEDARPWSEKSEKTVDGSIKWDGCSDFTIPQTHFCHGAESFAELHAVIQFTLGYAHTLLSRAEWAVVIPDLKTYFLQEVPITTFNRNPEVLTP